MVAVANRVEEITMTTNARVGDVLDPALTADAGVAQLGGARANLGIGDAFTSTASAFPTVPASYLTAFKVQQVTVQNDAGIMQPSVVLDRMLVDLAGLDPALMDPNRLIKDCDFVKALVLRNPELPRRLVAAFRHDAPTTDIVEAARLAKAAGFTEEASITAGGGLVVLVGALVVTIAAAFVTELIKDAAAIKYKHAVARATGSDPNSGISNQ